LTYKTQLQEKKAIFFLTKVPWAAVTEGLHNRAGNSVSTAMRGKRQKERMKKQGTECADTIKREGGCTGLPSKILGQANRGEKRKNWIGLSRWGGEGVI